MPHLDLVQALAALLALCDAETSSSTLARRDPRCPRPAEPGSSLSARRPHLGRLFLRVMRAIPEKWPAHAKRSCQMVFAAPAPCSVRGDERDLRRVRE